MKFHFLKFSWDNNKRIWNSVIQRQILIWKVLDASLIVMEIFKHYSLFCHDYKNLLAMINELTPILMPFHHHNPNDITHSFQTTLYSAVQLQVIYRNSSGKIWSICERERCIIWDLVRDIAQSWEENVLVDESVIPNSVELNYDMWCLLNNKLLLIWLNMFSFNIVQKLKTWANNSFRKLEMKRHRFTECLPNCKNCVFLTIMAWFV